MWRFIAFLSLALCMMACRKTSQDSAGQQTSATQATAVETEHRTVFQNVRQDAVFVGSTVCFDCHEDIWQSYQGHGMAQSYYPLTPERAVEDFTAAPLWHEATDFYYRVFEADGRFYQEEYRLDASGDEVHRLVRRMDYVIGSGTAARTYLTENNGRLYEMPLTWYTQTGQWDFSPGYRDRNTRFDRLIPDRCMGCHNSYPKTVTFTEGKYEEVPHGIGCERCHGPGSLHVDERLATPDPADEIDPTIVNPIHLELDRQLDVCQQCHLQGTVSVLREGRDPFSFRPSESLSDYVAFFSTDAPSATGQISVISHADRMKQSACFTGTVGRANGMTCVTCHNPHEGFRESGPAYFNDTCLDCHTPGSLQATFGTETARRTHVSSANCIACHMVKVEAEEAPHSSFTDHWIRVVASEPDLPALVASHDTPTLVPYFNRDASGEEARLYEGMAYIVLGNQQNDTLALAQGIAILEDVLADAAVKSGEGQFLLGLSQLHQGRIEQAIPPLEQAVRLDPDIPERLNALAQAYEAGHRDPVPTGRLYRRALAIQPALADVRVNYGRFLEVQGRLDEAMEQYRRAVDEKPWLAMAHYNLGTGYIQQGRFEEAETALRQALELEPDYPEALGNLGMLYASQGKTEQARVLFERAVTVAPDDAVALGNLGAYYLNEDELALALDLLRRAVEADPAYLDGLVNLSLAHFRNDDMEQARVYSQKALALDPSNAPARRILAALDL